MRIIVQKFGGTSLADSQRISRVADHVIETWQAGYAVVVVASAPAETTSQLFDRCSQIDELLPKREKDLLLSVGEQISISLLAMTLISRGVKAIALTGAQAGILTDDHHGRARILEIRTARIRSALEARQVVVVAGYQGVTTAGEITTLGRGGSDTTAVALAAALDAEQCQIWTDVAGVYSGHPGMVPDAPLIPELNFEEMLELADSGAKVLKASAVELAKRNGVVIGVGSSFSRQMGTHVSDKALDQNRVTGVTLEEEIVLVTLVNTRPGSNFALIATLAEHGLAVKSIWERGGECGLFFCESDLAVARSLIAYHYRNQPSVCLGINRELAFLSVVGAGVGFGTDVMVRALAVFAQMEIQPEHYFSSEMRVSFAIERQRSVEAVNRIHEVLIVAERSVGTSSEKAL